MSAEGLAQNRRRDGVLRKGGNGQMSVLIKGGRIVTAADNYFGDIFVENETVSLIGESLDVRADKVIDANGKYLIPGCSGSAHRPSIPCA
jgi:adenine deaminase